MATYDAIPGTEIAVDEAVKSTTATKLRDNPLAVAQGDPTALAAGEGVAIDFDFGGGSQTAPITDEASKGKVLGPDGAGSVVWVSGKTLVERKEISAAVASVTFSGLDGDIDEVYQLIGRIMKAPAGVAQYSLRPNGVTANLAGATVTNGGAAVQAARVDMIVATGTNAGILVSLEALIHARETVQSTAMARMFQGKAVEGDPTASLLNSVTDFGGMWDGTGNMTSLVIFSSLALGIGVGSTFELFRLGQ